MRAKIELALSRDADTIEFDVVRAGAEFCASHEDVAACDDRPTLDQVLQSEILARSDAPLLVEVKENDADPAAFATALLDYLQQHRDFVRNGRSLSLRALQRRLRYVVALKQLSVRYRFLSPYLRFGVLYSLRSYTDLVSFRAALRADAVDNGLDWVEIERRIPNVVSLIHYARSLGLAVGVWTIPPVDGAMQVTRFRDIVDSMASDYRVDQAKEALVASNLLARIDGSLCSSPADQVLQVFRNTAGLVSTTAAVNVPGSPGLTSAPESADASGCVLDFGSTSEPKGLLDLGPTPSASGGLWLSAHVRFAVLSLGDGARMPLLSSSSTTGFYLGLVGQPARTVLRFAVSGTVEASPCDIDVAQTGIAGRWAILNTSDRCHLVATYAAGTTRRWIDGRSLDCSAMSGEPAPGSGEHTLLGAAPGTAPWSSNDYFTGSIQEATVLDWQPPPSGEPN